MKKTLVFSDAHNAGKQAYKRLLDAALAEKVSSIKFLGDIDKNYHEFFRFMDFAAKAGIKVESIKGNHDQAWLDYANGLEDRCVATGNRDLTILGDKQATNYLQNLPTTITVEDILYTHAFPRGKRYSGQQGSRKIVGDHRFKYRELWHASFGTDKTTGTGVEAFDPEVLKWNFDELKQTAQSGFSNLLLNKVLGLKSINYMVKGHEHIPKIWTYEQGTKTVQGGKALNPGNKVNLVSPSIIQLGAFESGHYALMEKIPGAGLSIEYKRL